MDPRLAAIQRRLAPVGRILAVTGGKGGIGKSSVASVLALSCARRGLGTGLLDLDLTSPSDHVMLGAGELWPTEEFGVEPPRIHGIQLMSIAYFLGDHAAPLRGAEVSDALLEILAVTRWAETDVLVVDLPPGLGDVTLDVARWLPGAESLVVAADSPVVLETVRRNLRLLATLSLPVVGILENLCRKESAAVAALAEQSGVPFLGGLPFDPELEQAWGDSPRIAETAFARALEGVAGILFAE